MAILLIEQNFAQWLQSRPEYDYIIDGPNVAYQNQNHFYGRFSYRQVSLPLKSFCY
jgi:hypothetical protein